MKEKKYTSLESRVESSIRSLQYPFIDLESSKGQKIKRNMIHSCRINGWTPKTSMSEYSRFRSFEHLFEVTASNLSHLSEEDLDRDYELMPRNRKQVIGETKEEEQGNFVCSRCRESFNVHEQAVDAVSEGL